MTKRFFLTIAFTTALYNLFGQSFANCSQIVHQPDSVAVYKNGMKDVLNFFSKNITPSIDSCYQNEGRLISNLQVQLTIDSTGKVIAAHVLRPDLPLACRTPIQQGFLLMDRWKPAVHKGVNVCSSIRFPIRINWK